MNLGDQEHRNKICRDCIIMDARRTWAESVVLGKVAAEIWRDHQHFPPVPTLYVIPSKKWLSGSFRVSKCKCLFSEAACNSQIYPWSSREGPCINLPGLPWQIPQTGWLKWQKWIFSVLEAGCPRSRRQWAALVLRPLFLASRWLHSPFAFMWSFPCVCTRLCLHFLCF